MIPVTALSTGPWTVLWELCYVINAQLVKVVTLDERTQKSTDERSALVVCTG